MKTPFRRKAKQKATVTEQAPAPVIAQSSVQRPLQAFAAHQNLLACPDGVYAYFRLSEVDVQNVSHEQQSYTMSTAANGWAAFRGCLFKLHGLSAEFPYATWAEDLDAATAATRPPDAPGDPEDPNRPRTFNDYIRAGQDYAILMNAKRHASVLGVRFTTRKVRNSADLALLLSPVPLTDRHAGWESERLKLKEITDSLGRGLAGNERIGVPDHGLAARPMKANEVRWVIHTTLGAGAPTPARLLTSPIQGWDAADAAGFTGPVVSYADPASKTTVVKTIRGGVEYVRHVAVLHVEDIEERDETTEAHLLGWLNHTRTFDFPVDFVAVMQVIPPSELLLDAEMTRRNAKNFREHLEEHGEDGTAAQEAGIEIAHKYEAEVNKGSRDRGTRLRGVIMLSVSGEHEDELYSKKVNTLIESFSLNMKVELVADYGQYDSYRAFVPGEPVTMTGHQTQMNAAMFSSSFPNASTSAGDSTGMLVGPIAGGHDMFVFDPHGGAKRNRSNMMVICGSLGAGKSTVMGAMADFTASIMGAQTIFNDPSGPMARLCEMPHIKSEARHVDLGSAKPGLLCPSLLIPEPQRAFYANDHEYQLEVEKSEQERVQTTLDALTLMLPPSLLENPRIAADTELFLMQAVNEVGGGYGVNPWRVIQRLWEIGRTSDSNVPNQVGDALKWAARGAAGRQVFLPEEQMNADVDDKALGRLTDNLLTVITMVGMETPPKGVDKSQWTTTQRASLPTMFLSSRFALRAMYANTKPKAVFSDELAIATAGTSAFNALMSRGSSDSRKWNTLFVLGSQNPATLTSLSPQIANLVGSAWVGRMGDDEAARAATDLLRAPRDMGYHHVLSGLGDGEFMVLDWTGKRRHVAFDLAHVHYSLIEALDTTPGGAKGRAVQHDRFFEGVA